MKIKLTFLLITTIVSFTSCKKDLVVPETSHLELFNKWTWIKTSGGFAGTLKTPDSEGYTKSLEFSSKGLYTERRNNNLIKKVEFNIETGESIHSVSKVYLITYGKEEKAKQSFIIKNDTLFLFDEIYDGFNSVYVKVKEE